MMHCQLILGCAPTLSFNSAIAGDQVFFALIGTGGLSCARRIDHQKQPNYKAQMDAVVHWVWGFIAAYNARGFFDANVRREVTQVTPPDDSVVRLFLGQFCARDPNGYVVSGTLSMIKDLGGAVVGRPEEIKVPGG